MQEVDMPLPPLKVAVVCGNPKVNSRTLAVAEAVAKAAAAAADRGVNVSTHTIDLGHLGGQLFDWSSEPVKAEVAALSGADLAIIASPTYKATYTGLLKSFLDWFGQSGLAGVVAIPVMVGGSAVHALAPEVYLRPLLVEIGAIVPTRGLFILDSELEALDATLQTWSDGATDALRRTLRPE
jgi:FMN reductase